MIKTLPLCLSLIYLFYFAVVIGACCKRLTFNSAQFHVLF